MIDIVVVKRADPRDKAAPALYYGCVKRRSNVDLDDLAEHMSKHNTPFSKGAIEGVLADMVNCINELLLDGHTVSLGKLGTFRLTIKSGGAGNPDDWELTDVKSIHMRFKGTAANTPTQLMRAAEFRNLRKEGVLTSDEYADAGIEL